MQINELKLKSRRKKKKTIGRGGKKGTYSGRGNKGQKARSGAKIDPLFEGGRSTLIDHMKKKKGFKSKMAKKKILNLKDLENNFSSGEAVNLKSLIKKGLLVKIKRESEIKILGKGTLSKKITVSRGILLSSSSRKAIEKAGGKIINTAD